ncbi:MAG: sodium:solute symporter family protein [Desulfofustis sp. PB-SRB1]|jgi:SSS family solute:Na+ symporter|nr:sodium:solute symporter family protein [Desulfofustis sp. PB-SRB1]MBM1002406.1 sodium:solute symporter family protein [Desulfofustis sp. PB-SRB1]HBH28866.1 sodium:solute symporter family protein [Desulfofustis sp.]HBH32784.1 sodium:solute symporter family protein [Desulfofustis sp.]
MEPRVWVWIFLLLYIVYCFWWGLRGYFTEKTASGYAIGGRSIPFIAFLMAATAASFSGWTTVGHPGLIWRDGLAYAFASFYVLTIPITGAFFAKRNWLLGKRYGFVTPGDMFAYYYNNEAVRWLTVLSAVLYSMFYSGLQLIAAAKLFEIVAGVPYVYGLFFMAFIVWFYVVTGGLKASTWVGVIQFILLVLSIVVLGYFTVTCDALGGWSVFSAKIGELDAKYLEVPAVIKFELGTGGWTSVMILTYMFALMGIQSSPAFTLWNYGMSSPKPLAWQQVFMSTFVVGIALFFFTAFQGMGARILQGMGEISPNVDGDVVPMLMNYLLPGPMMAIVFLGIIAAIHSTAAPYIGTGGTIVLRDVYWRYFKKQEAGHAEQIWANRIFVTILTALAIFVSLTAPGAIVMIGGFATAFGFIMYLMLLGVHYGFRYPAIGVVIGLIGAIAACFVTYFYYRYPLTMHTAFWGLFVGLIIAYICRGIGIKDSEETIKRQQEIRVWINDVDGPSERGQKWRNAMKFLVPLWYVFAIGPLCIIGNNAFKFAGFPAVWSWQIVWWIIGIVMMWALCFKAEMSTTSEEQIKRAGEEQMIVVKEA